MTEPNLLETNTPAPQQESQAPTPATPSPAPTNPEQPAGASDGGNPVQNQEAGKASTPAPDVKHTWPDNWRDQMAKGNEKLAQRLSRYASPEAAAEALLNAQDKISSGGLKTPAPKDNPEALTRWRQENGIPESYDKYDLTMPDGIVLGENDMPMVEGFLKEMHQNNVPPDVVKAAVAWYKGREMEALTSVAKFDKDNFNATQQELIAEWGGEFAAEKNSISNFLETNGMQELQFARLPDGSLLGNNAAMLRKLSALAREVNPAGTVVPGASNSMQSMEQEISAIEKKMGTTSYSDSDSTRYMQLITARDKVKSRQG